MDQGVGSVYSEEGRKDARKSCYSDSGWEAGMRMNRKAQHSLFMDHADRSENANGRRQGTQKRRKAFTRLGLLA